MRRKRLSGGWNPRVERRGFRIARSVVVGLLVVVGAGLGILHNRLQARQRPDPLLGTAQTIALPAQVAAARTRNGVTSTWRGWFGGVALVRENEQLQKQVGALTLELERLKDVEEENSRLRRLTEIISTKSPKPKVAEVIAWLPTAPEQTIMIAQGSQQGIQRDQVVRTAEGLLGKITEVGPLSAKVRLLVDPDSGVGAVVGAGKAFGILRGVEERQGKLLRRYRLELTHLDKLAEVKPGDTIATSGQGGVFPPGIPIGTIESVQEDRTHLLKVARVKPYAPQPGMVREVLVLAAVKP